MAEQHEFDCPGHTSIYQKDYSSNNYQERSFKVYFSIPDKGVNNETGILLFIAGFGAGSKNNIYKKMRKEFADKYNLVTIQCDYFGSEFMLHGLEKIGLEASQRQDLERQLTQEEYEKVIKDNVLDMDQLGDIASYKKIDLSCQVIQNEQLNNFNDMGYMQAIDNITATLKVMAILYNNQYIFNTNKVMIMGNSHGAYLGYLCNIMCPELFKYILDNSSWNYPVYLKGNRMLVGNYNHIEVKYIYEYLGKKIGIDAEELRIKKLYSRIHNKCKIVVYHGVNDTLVPIEEKLNELDEIENIVFNIISNEQVGKGIFANTEHGLGADFIKHFEHFYTNYVEQEKVESTLKFHNSVYMEGAGIRINYAQGIPEIII